MHTNQTHTNITKLKRNARNPYFKHHWQCNANIWLSSAQYVFVCSTPELLNILRHNNIKEKKNPHPELRWDHLCMYWWWWYPTQDSHSHWALSQLKHMWPVGNEATPWNYATLFQLFSKITTICRFLDLWRGADALLPLVVLASCSSFDRGSNVHWIFSYGNENCIFR